MNAARSVLVGAGEESMSELPQMLMRGQSTYEELDLALDSDFEHFGEDGARRAWKREAVVRIVEYSPYPRRDSSEHRAVGFTANESRGGLCILTREADEVGQSLRLTVREVDGRVRLEAIAKVVWCNPEAGDRVALGLEFIEVRTRAPGLDPIDVRTRAPGLDAIEVRTGAPGLDPIEMRTGAAPHGEPVHRGGERGD